MNAPLRHPIQPAPGSLWRSDGTATRRQWWFGQIAALVFAALGFIGGVSVLVAAMLQFGLDPETIAARIAVLLIAALCGLVYVIASNALCRRRLNARGLPHDLVDAFVGLTVLEALIALNDAGRMLAPDQWPLPAAPGWLGTIVSAGSYLTLVATALECGVLQRFSLTELWRGRAVTWRRYAPIRRKPASFDLTGDIRR